MVMNRAKSGKNRMTRQKAKHLRTMGPGEGDQAQDRASTGLEAFRLQPKDLWLQRGLRFCQTEISTLLCGWAGTAAPQLAECLLAKPFAVQKALTSQVGFLIKTFRVFHSHHITVMTTNPGVPECPECQMAAFVTMMLELKVRLGVARGKGVGKED